MKENKKNYHHGALKAALINAGLAELEEKGLESLSLRAIAARVGVSHTAPKNHFDGLRGLLTAIATRGFRMHIEEMQRDAKDLPPGQARLSATGNGYLRFALKYPQLYKLMFSNSLRDRSDPDLKSAAWASYDILRNVSHGLDWDKADAAGAPWRTEWMIWSLLHGYAMLLIECEIKRNEDGTPIFDMSDLLPAFGYRKAELDVMPPAFQGS